MNILDEIIAHKKNDVLKKFQDESEVDLHKNGEREKKNLDFAGKLKNPDSISVIAEIKKASPSKGIIREKFDPGKIAHSYIQNGADCLSILTESKYFLGSPEYLENIAENYDIPLLRKDFMIHPRQIKESYEMGADAILLIVGVLSKKELCDFKKIADEFELTCLTEVHTREELMTALECDLKVIGVNNRNLKTFKTSLENSLKLIREIPSDCVKISESGIYSSEQANCLYEAGFDAVLIGESLMRLEDPGSGITKIKSGCDSSL